MALPSALQFNGRSPAVSSGGYRGSPPPTGRSTGGPSICGPVNHLPSGETRSGAAVPVMNAEAEAMRRGLPPSISCRYAADSPLVVVVFAMNTMRCPSGNQPAFMYWKPGAAIWRGSPARQYQKLRWIPEEARKRPLSIDRQCDAVAGAQPHSSRRLHVTQSELPVAT